MEVDAGVADYQPRAGHTEPLSPLSTTGMEMKQ